MLVVWPQLALKMAGTLSLNHAGGGCRIRTICVFSCSPEMALITSSLIDRLASLDIIQVRIEVSLRDRLHGCGLQGLG